MRTAIVALTLLLTASATAADGVYEIHKLCVPIGCFAGDSAGLPVQITQPGSYRLTSDIETESTSVTGIEITSGLAHVSIDMNGFALLGPRRCTGDLPDCGSGGGFQSAIQAFNARHLIIKNGAIKGFNSGIIATGDALLALISNVRIDNSRSDAFAVPEGAAILRNITASNNGGFGVRGNPLFLGQLVLMDSVLTNNGPEGMEDGLCSANTFTSNGDRFSVSEQACHAQFDTNLCAGAPCP